jgi:hypothetical protein
MYVLMEYLMTKDDGRGNTESSPVRVIDFSEDLNHFSNLSYVPVLLEALGHAKVSRKYRGKYKMLLNLNHENLKGGEKIKKMIRDKNINDVLSI